MALHKLLDEPLSVFASLTLDVCICLENAKQPSWLGDLKCVLNNLHCHYLHLCVIKHRKALIRLLFSDHQLALEQFWRTDCFHLLVPYDNQLCRLCGLAVELPEHAILICNGDSNLVDLCTVTICLL